MVLHRYHRGYGIERAVGITQSQDVGELQRRATGKQNLARGAEFDDGTFLNLCATGLAGIIRTAAAGKLYGNVYRRSFGEKARQFSNRAGLRRPRLSCGWLRQTIFTLSLMN